MDELMSIWNEYAGLRMRGRSGQDTIKRLGHAKYQAQDLVDLFENVSPHSGTGPTDDHAYFLYKAVYGDLEWPIPERKDAYEEANGYYRYIPIWASSFLERMQKVMSAYYDISWKMLNRNMPYASHSTRFVDVGGGIGDKALYAKLLLGFRYATSFEYNKDTHAVAKERIGTGFGISVERGDAMRHNFGRYKRRLFLYMYCPIHHWDKLMKMYKNVIYTMPDGSVMYDIGQSVGYGSALKDLASEQEVLGDACDPSRKSEYAIAKFNGKLYAIQVR